MTIKNFNDLVFTDHANNPDGVQAILSVGNDLNISVVSMKNSNTQYGGLYGDASNGTYEVAVFHNDSMLPLSPWDDVLGWQTEDELNELMASLQGRQAYIAGAIAQMHNDRKEAQKELKPRTIFGRIVDFLRKMYNRVIVKVNGKRRIRSLQ